MGNLALDLTLATLSGIVMASSIFQIIGVPRAGKAQGKVGLMGILAAVVGGLCPCYYLVPLLAVAGGLGGALAVVGIAFYAYQIPIKLSSLALLGFVTYSLERSLRASCSVDLTKLSSRV